MKKIIVLLLLADPALAHTGHGAASLFHLHAAELSGVLLLTLLGLPALYRAWRRGSRK